MKLGELQEKIMVAIASKQPPIILQHVADSVDRKPPTVLESMKPLFEKQLLVSYHESARSRRLIRLTDFGALHAIQSVPYTEVYKNHPYLRMPELIQKFGECFTNERLRNQQIEYLSKLIASEFAWYAFFLDGNLFPPGNDRRWDHLLAAIMIDRIIRLLDIHPSKHDVDKEAVLNFLHEAEGRFGNAVERTIDEMEKAVYGKTNVRSKAERIERAKSLSKSEAEAKLRDTIKKNKGVRGIVSSIFDQEDSDFPSVAEKTSAGQKADRRNRSS